MKTIKVAEATERQLDWLVAKCVGRLHKDQLLNGTTMYGWWISGLFVDSNYWICLNEFKPSSNWAQGGPIIYQHDISMIRVYKDYPHPWLATHGEFIYMNADTPLLAAMRCFVTSRLGEEVEVPDELA